MKRLLLIALFLVASAARAAPIDDAAAANARGDYAAELRITRPLAEKGEAWAQYFLGFSYRNGEGVPKNDAEAVKWYRLAAAQGHAKAQYNLGAMYDFGQGVAQNKTEAAKWYRLAAAQRNAEAQNSLGALYSNGHGVVQDYAEAVKWYKLAAAEGYSGAHHNLGTMYRDGQGVVRDYVRAHMWFNLAAVKGDGTISTILAVNNRDVVASKMTPQQIGEAQKLARECQARAFKGC